MLKIQSIKELNQINNIPDEILSIVTENLTILDTAYGAERDVNDGYGGFVLLVQVASDLPLLRQHLANIYVDLADTIPEYVEPIVCSDGQIFSHTLILCGSDFGVLLLIPMELTPDNLKNYLP